MLELTTDLWKFEFLLTVDAICFTSNGVVKSDGSLVMGGGVAKEFADRYPWLPKMMGHKVKLLGNIPILIDYYNFTTYKPAIVSFPTKNHWKNPSDLELIKASAVRLKKIADTKGYNRIALPRPGVGLGGLNWPIQVRPAIVDLLDDRFVVVSK